MIFAGDGTLLDPNGAELPNDLCNDPDLYCFTAAKFKEKGWYVNFRRALVRASALVEPILRTEHPRILACFLEVFIHLIQTGNHDPTLFRRQFVKKMAARVTDKGYPRGQICLLLGNLIRGLLARPWEKSGNALPILLKANSDRSINSLCLLVSITPSACTGLQKTWKKMNGFFEMLNGQKRYGEAEKIA
jgi:hypothetical protein